MQRWCDFVTDAGDPHWHVCQVCGTPMVSREPRPQRLRRECPGKPRNYVGVKGPTPNRRNPPTFEEMRDVWGRVLAFHQMDKATISLFESERRLSICWECTQLTTEEETGEVKCKRLCSGCSGTHSTKLIEVLTGNERACPLKSHFPDPVGEDLELDLDWLRS